MYLVPSLSLSLSLSLSHGYYYCLLVLYKHTICLQQQQQLQRVKESLQKHFIWHMKILNIVWIQCTCVLLTLLHMFSMGERTVLHVRTTSWKMINLPFLLYWICIEYHRFYMLCCFSALLHWQTVCCSYKQLLLIVSVLHFTSDLCKCHFDVFLQTLQLVQVQDTG